MDHMTKRFSVGVFIFLTFSSLHGVVTDAPHLFTQGYVMHASQKHLYGEDFCPIFQIERSEVKNERFYVSVVLDDSFNKKGLVVERLGVLAAGKGTTIDLPRFGKVVLPGDLYRMELKQVNPYLFEARPHIPVVREGRDIVYFFGEVVSGAGVTTIVGNPNGSSECCGGNAEPESYGGWSCLPHDGLFTLCQQFVKNETFNFLARTYESVGEINRLDDWGATAGLIDIDGDGLLDLVLRVDYGKSKYRCFINGGKNLRGFPLEDIGFSCAPSVSFKPLSNEGGAKYILAHETHFASCGHQSGDSEVGEDYLYSIKGEEARKVLDFPSLFTDNGPGVLQHTCGHDISSLGEIRILKGGNVQVLMKKYEYEPLGVSPESELPDCDKGLRVTVTIHADVYIIDSISGIAKRRNDLEKPDEVRVYDTSKGQTLPPELEAGI